MLCKQICLCHSFSAGNNRKSVLFGSKSTGYAHYLALTSTAIIWSYCTVITLEQGMNERNICRSYLGSQSHLF